jgi:hypothetical protein
LLFQTLGRSGIVSNFNLITYETQLILRTIGITR